MNGDEPSTWLERRTAERAAFLALGAPDRLEPVDTSRDGL